MSTASFYRLLGHSTWYRVLGLRLQHRDGVGGCQLPETQIAVDAAAQIIVSTHVTQQTNDKQQLVPMAEAILANVGQLAATTSADAGYFSARNVEHPALAATNLLVPPDRQKHGSPLPLGSCTADAATAQHMRHKVSSTEGRAKYKMRKAIVEPVFGQIKEARGLRRFLLRGFLRRLGLAPERNHLSQKQHGMSASASPTVGSATWVVILPSGGGPILASAEASRLSAPRRTRRRSAPAASESPPPPKTPVDHVPSPRSTPP